MKVYVFLWLNYKEYTYYLTIDIVNKMKLKLLNLDKIE